MASKVGCLVSFCHNCLSTTSVHMHAYCYPLIESGAKSGLRTIGLCRIDIVLLCKHNEQQ